MLMWMIYNGEITPFFTHGHIRPYTLVFSIVAQEETVSRHRGTPEFDAAVRAEFVPEIAQQIVGRADMDRVYDASFEWADDEPAHPAAWGFFLFADVVDWEKGTLKANLHSQTIKGDQSLSEDEHLASQFDEPDFEVELSGLCFPMDDVEMLQPGYELSRTATLHTGAKAIGRPPKWDWEGAMAHMTGLAQRPDGLPIGSGAQAQIEHIIADWFVATIGDCPAISQIRSRAQAIMRSIEKTKK